MQSKLNKVSAILYRRAKQFFNICYYFFFFQGQVGKLKGKHRFSTALIKSVVKSQGFSRNQGRVGTLHTNLH